jgi:hypothetical protein
VNDNAFAKVKAKSSATCPIAQQNLHINIPVANQKIRQQKRIKQRPARVPS